MTRFNLTLTAPAASITATDSDTRRLAGVAIPYGEQGATSAGVLTIDAGAVKVPENLRAVKLFREHGRQIPTGYAVEATDSPDALRMAFTVARTPDGDQALLEASEGLRDALSVELTNVDVESGHVVAADLVAVAQVAVPAFASAVLTAALDDEAQAQVNDLAQQITDLTKADEETEETPPAESEGTMTETATASAPAALSMTPATPNRRPDPFTDRHVWASMAAEAMRGATDAAQVNAALSDIVPSTAGSDSAFMRPAWLGKLWSPAALRRPVINAIGASPLTAMKMDSWKWNVKPVVSPYAGEKAAIPSGPASITPVQATAQRIAGGWDLDRIYLDFDNGFIAAFQDAAVEDYRKKTETYLVDGHGAVTGPPAIPAFPGLVSQAFSLGALADVPTALAGLTGYLAGKGANTSFIVMASNVWAKFATLPAATVPWWLQGQGSLNLSGTADVAGVTLTVDPAMAAGTMLAGDRNAVTFWETGPINVQAVNLPQGGIDLALFGYYASQVHDVAGLVTCTVTAVGTQEAEGEQTPTAKKK